MIWERSPTQQLFAAATSVLVGNTEFVCGHHQDGHCEQRHLSFRKGEGNALAPGCLTGPRNSLGSGPGLLGWAGLWVALRGMSSNPHPMHTVCGPGFGERDRGKGRGEGHSPSRTHYPPAAATVLNVSSDPHCDLALPLERFVRAAANEQDGDSEDITSRAAHVLFYLERKR